MGSIDEVELQRVENARLQQSKMQPATTLWSVLIVLGLILKIVATMLYRH